MYFLSRDKKVSRSKLKAEKKAKGNIHLVIY